MFEVKLCKEFLFVIINLEVFSFEKGVLIIVLNIIGDEFRFNKDLSDMVLFWFDMINLVLYFFLELLYLVDVWRFLILLKGDVNIKFIFIGFKDFLIDVWILLLFLNEVLMNDLILFLFVVCFKFSFVCLNLMNGVLMIKFELI